MDFSFWSSFFGSERSQTFSCHIKLLKTSLARSLSALMWNRINAETHFSNVPFQFPFHQRSSSNHPHYMRSHNQIWCCSRFRGEKKEEKKEKWPGVHVCGCVCPHPWGAVTSLPFSAPRQNGNGRAYYPDVCPLGPHTNTHRRRRIKSKKERSERRRECDCCYGNSWSWRETNIIVSLHLCRSSQQAPQLLNLWVSIQPLALGPYNWFVFRVTVWWTERISCTPHVSFCLWQCVRVLFFFFFCCIFTPVERRGSQTEIPLVIFGGRGNIFTVVIHPAPDKFTWLPSNNLPNVV